MNNVTFMVKTIARPRCLERLLASLRQFYPDTPVVVADDGGEADVATGKHVCHQFGGVFHVPYPYNLGAPACYNSMLAEWIGTKYVCLLDDDFVFIEDTRIEDLVAWVEAGVFDVMGGSVRARKNLAAFVGALQWDRDEDQVRFERLWPRMPYEQAAPIQADVIPNFWVAAADTVRRCPWDAEQKVFRHLDWFMYAKYRNGLKRSLDIGYLNSVRVDHHHVQSGTYYEDLRHGAIPEYRARFCVKWGVAEVIGD